jgi:predicted dehydrogenase
MASSSSNWGILAAGGIAHTFAKSALASGSKLVAVASRSAGKSQAFADAYDISHAYRSYEELLANPSINIVYIANTHNFHCDTVKSALQAGKHVLCEKPLGVSVSETQEMINLARELGLFLMEGMWSRFLEPMVKIKSWIKEGHIGELRYLNADFGFAPDVDDEHRVFNPKLAGGALLDVGIYPVALANMLAEGSPIKSLHGETSLHRTGVDTDDQIMLTYQNGLKASLRCSITTRLKNEAEIIGTKGRIVIQPWFHAAEKAQLFNNDVEVESIHTPRPEGEGFVGQIKHVEACLHEGRLESTVMPLSDTLDIAQIMESLLKDWGIQYA